MKQAIVAAAAAAFAGAAATAGAADSRGAAAHATASAVATASSTASVSTSTSATISYHTVTVNGLKIFYREAGDPAKPTLLLLHGFPSSSRMFDTLMPLLADRYHLVAPDYPGFGQSDAPPANEFAYTFDHLAEVVGKFTEQLGITSYAMYVQDYGGPVGFRIALKHPERIRAIVVQNAVSDEAGLGPAWDKRRAFWANRAKYENEVIPNFTSLETAKLRHIGTSPHAERYNPDTWLDEYAFLSRPGQRQIQSDLFYDYQNNVANYPRWQEWMRRQQPKMLVLWGRYDPSFAVGGAPTYKRDVPSAEVHMLEAGHFALDEKLDDIAALMRDFLGRTLR
jgi:pimeloyl-ACP methyl ester carboxylesterase